MDYFVSGHIYSSLLYTATLLSVPMKMGEIWKSMWHFTKRNTKSWHQPAIQSEQMQGPVLLWAMQSVLPLRTLSGYLEVEEQETPYTKGLLSQLLYWKANAPMEFPGLWGTPRL